MSRFRAFIKKRTDIGGNPITSADMRVLAFDIKRDLLTKATSTVSVLNIPSAVTEGDILGIYDEKGKIIYTGVINRISEEIECDQIVSLFDDNWRWSFLEMPTLEETLVSIIENDFRNSTDPILKQTFNFNVSAISETALQFPTQEANKVINFSDWIYSIYADYGIRFFFDIPFNQATPTIQIGHKSFPNIILASNAVSVLSIEHTQQVFETNKLMIYSKEGDFRETWYGTANGITNNADDLSRFQKVNTKIVFSNDDIETIKAQNLRAQMYNHEISVSLLPENNFYNFETFHLGQPFSIHTNNLYFNSIYTGHELLYENEGFTSVIMRFGMVRTRLEDKLYKYVIR